MRSSSSAVKSKCSKCVSIQTLSRCWIFLKIQTTTSWWWSICRELICLIIYSRGTSNLVKIELRISRGSLHSAWGTCIATVSCIVILSWRISWWLILLTKLCQSWLILALRKWLDPMRRLRSRSEPSAMWLLRFWTSNPIRTNVICGAWDASFMRFYAHHFPSTTTARKRQLGWRAKIKYNSTRPNGSTTVAAASTSLPNYWWNSPRSASIWSRRSATPGSVKWLSATRWTPRVPRHKHASESKFGW